MCLPNTNIALHYIISSFTSKSKGLTFFGNKLILYYSEYFSITTTKHTSKYTLRGTKWHYYLFSINKE